MFKSRRYAFAAGIILLVATALFAILVSVGNGREQNKLFAETFGVRANDAAAQSRVNGIMDCATESTIQAYSQLLSSTNLEAAQKWYNLCYRQLENHQKLALQFGFKIPDAATNFLKNHKPIL